MPGIPALILLCLSVIAWIYCVFHREKVMLWIYAALDRRFVKRPNLDVGLVYLFGFANLAVMTLLLSQVYLVSSIHDSRDSLSQKATVTKPENASVVPSASSEATHDLESDRGTISGGTSSGETQSEVREAPSNEKDADGAKPALDSTPLSIRFIQSLLMVVVLAIMIRLSYSAYGTSSWQWGWGPIADSRWAATAGVSLLVFVLLVPPVLVLHELLSLFAKYDHSTLDTLAQLKLSGDWLSIGIIFVNTAIMVPILEESVFRGAIQGFAEQFNTYRQHWMRWSLGPLNSTTASWLGLSRAATEANNAGKGHRSKDSNEAFWGPIVFSSLLFGIAHTGQGAAPISLYFLAMGLGWIYKKTGNLAICILVHSMLNAWTLALAFLK